MLFRKVEADRLKDSTALFLCVAPVETAVDEKVFSGRPDNSIRAHLRREFRKQDWPWPAYFNYDAQPETIIRYIKEEGLPAAQRGRLYFIEVEDLFRWQLRRNNEDG